MSPRRVLLADPHAFTRLGVGEVLEKAGGRRVVAEAKDGDEAIALDAKHRPGVIVMEPHLSAVNGIEVARHVLRTRPTVQIVMLSADEDVDVVAAAMRAGARAYVSKHGAPDDLLVALDACAHGEVHISPRLLARTGGAALANGDARTEQIMLTAVERNVLQLVAEGHSSRQIATRLHRSEKTIEATRHRITRKLGLFSVAELTKYAVRRGITSLEG